MTLKTVPQLNSDNACEAASRPGKTKHAILCWSPANYTISLGKQSFTGPHMFIDGRYGCALIEFFKTHLPIASKENTWFVGKEILAMLTTEDMKLQDLTTVDGNKEAIYEIIPAGTWIIQNKTGEQYTNTKIEFTDRYELSDDSIEKIV